MNRNVGILVVLLSWFLAGCSAFQRPVETRDLSGNGLSRDEPDRSLQSMGALVDVLDGLSSRLQEIERRQDWLESPSKKVVAAQSVLADARKYRKVLETISKSAKPNLSQRKCAEALEFLSMAEEEMALLLGTESGFDELRLASAEDKIDAALVRAKGCVVNYGEVTYVYFQLDDSSGGSDGRSVPGGLNPKFSEVNDGVFEKLRVLCGKEGVVHLYGYSCDLGTLEYNQRLARDRAENFRAYLDTLLSEYCPGSARRTVVESSLGGVIDFAAPKKYLEFLEYQRERHRVVAVFLFLEDS